MSLSAFELDLLGWVANDYEAVHTIRDDVARDLGRSVSSDEVLSALLTLVRLGLVDAFVYDVSSSQYRRANVEEASVVDHWFLVNEAGLAEHRRASSRT
jgi:hypothetical protein